MSVADGTIETAIKRCAVCKVDLKGRFVFVDEAVEAMLEQSMEQLFGKSILSFMDEPGQETFKLLLKKRSSYETTFDYTRLNFIAASGVKVQVGITMSVCFAAGNPVNYQILINSDYEIASETTNSPLNSASELLEALVETDREDIESLAGSIINYLDPIGTALYSYANDQLVIIETPSQAPATLPEAGLLHLETLRQNREYWINNPQQTQWAIETAGEAPNELLIPLQAQGGEQYLLRVVLNELLADAEVNDLVRRTGQVAHLMRGWLAQSEPTKTESEAENLTANERPDLGPEVFAQLGLAAFAIATNGRIVASNAQAMELVLEQPEGKHYHELLADTLRPAAQTDLTELRVFLEQAGSDSLPDRYQISIILPDLKVAKLIILRTDYNESGSSLLFVILPQSGIGSTRLSDRISQVTSLALSTLEPLIGTATEFAQKLSHEQYGRLSQDGSFALLCLQDCLSKIGGNLQSNQKLLNHCVPQSSSTQCDMNVLLADLQVAMRRAWPDLEITLDYPQMPKINISPNALKGVLEILMDHLVPNGSKRAFKAKISSETLEENLIITLALKSDFSEQILRELWDLHKTSACQGESLPNTKALSGVVMNLLLSQMNAGLEIAANERHVLISIPTQGEPSAR